MTPQSVFRSPRLVSAAAALAVLLPASAFADTVDVSVTNLVSKQIFVESNGSSYHNTSHLANLVADVRIQVDAEVLGSVRSWRVWLELLSEDGDSQEYPSFDRNKSYGLLERPSQVDRTERLIVPAAAWKTFVLARCNEIADNLRAEGLGNNAIFDQDRKLLLAVNPKFDVDLSGPGTYFIGAQPWSDLEKVEVICKKWPGAAIPQASDDLAVTPTKVVNKGLSIYEQYGIGGLCKIRLDGWITTDRKNTEVSFRYRNQEGKLSEVWTVDTGENRTATFSHWYTIQDNGFSESGIALAETGFVRMVGVSHDFKSDWAEYTMECVEGGPGALTANEPPKLTMMIVEQGKVEVHGYLCPEQLKLVGVLEGRGNFSGQVVFAGTSYISPPRDYDITRGQKIPFGADVIIDWSETPPPSPHGPMGQYMRFGLNVTGPNDAVVASIAPREHFAQCFPPRLNPVVEAQGGLTVEPRQSDAGRARNLGGSARLAPVAVGAPFAILAPKTQIRDGVIRLRGPATAKYALRFFAESKNRYKAVSGRGLPSVMTGTRQGFDVKALQAMNAKRWRLEVCPLGSKDKKACQMASFSIEAAAARTKATVQKKPKPPTTRTQAPALRQAN